MDDRNDIFASSRRLREAGVKDVIEKITRKIRDSETVKKLVEKVMRFFRTRNPSDDLTPSEVREIYHGDDYGDDFDLPSGNELDVGWTDHSKYRSQLRDVDPSVVNGIVRDFAEKHPDVRKKVQLHGPSRSQAVVDVDTKSSPERASVITVLATDISDIPESNKNGDCFIARTERIADSLRIKTLMQQSAAKRRLEEREKVRYVSLVGPWLQRIAGPESKARHLADKISDAIPGRNSGMVLTQRKNRWVKEAKSIPEILEFTEYIGGPERMNGSALYIVRDVVFGQVLLREAKSTAEKMASNWFIEKAKESKSNVFDEAGYPDDFRTFLPPNVSFNIGPTREVLEIVETFGREKKNWTAIAKKLAFIASRFNEIVRSVKKDMLSGNEETRLCALMTAITIETGLRPGAVGNGITIKDPDTGEEISVDTFGVTTMQAQHVRFIRNNFAELRFIGKMGTEQVASLTDSEVLKALKEAVDSTSLNGNTSMLFVTKNGSPVGDAEMRKYVSSKWGDISPTDFRKLKATREFYEGLRSRVSDMRKQFSRAVGSGKSKLKDMVVAKIMEVLEASAKQAQLALSHDDWKITIKSYVDPRVVVNFLNMGGLDDTLEDILVNNKNVKLVFNMDAFMDRRGL